MKQIHVAEGIDLYVNQSEKFKTNLISVYIHQPLLRETITKNALIPMVLTKGCRSFPTARSIEKELMMLYGGKLENAVVKKGDLSSLYFSLEFAKDRFVPEKIEQRAVSLLFDIIFRPNADCFSDNIVKIEKKNLKEQIQNMIDNKRYYAKRRCAEIMCEGQPYALNEYGYIEDLNAIDGSQLNTRYQDVIRTAPIDIFISGEIDPAAIEKAIKERLSDRTPVPAQAVAVIGDTNDGVKKVTDTLNITQGKINLGYKTGVSPKSDALYQLMVYNSVLGSGVHSKLFNNVREKLSLCYYVASQIDRFKGIMFIDSGVEQKNFKAATDEIERQMEEIRIGNIADFELEASKKSLCNAVRSTADNDQLLSDFYMNGILAGQFVTVDEFMQKINAVTKEDVQKISQNIKLDTMYFMQGGAQ